MELKKPGESDLAEAYHVPLDIGFDKIRADVKADIANAKTLEELDKVRLKYLGKNGIITLLMREFARGCSV
jgi:hypothetical protein